MVILRGDAGGPRFDGIGVVNGGGGTSVLLKDYPERQRGQILDLLFKPKFGASVGALLVEIPGDGNSTQGSTPSHMHTRDDLNYHRGYTWWVLSEARARNPKLTLTGMAWSAPGWVGNGNFWSQDTADYYIKWLSGLRSVYGLEFDALGLRNEKGVDFPFAQKVRATLNANGFARVKVQGFDNWTEDKLSFVKEMLTDKEKRDSIDILSGHTLVARPPHDGEHIRQWSRELNKPIWNSEEHVYKEGFDAEISIVQAFNLNFIRYGATLVVNWYDIAGLYPMEPYSLTPAALLARSPWSGNYIVREALWGYAHYGQFAQPGWQYLDHAYGELPGGGSYVTLKSPSSDYSIIVETKDAKATQQMHFKVGGGLSSKPLSVWRSDAKEQFTRQTSIQPVHGEFTLTLEPNTIYSLTTTTGQQKGGFADIPSPKPFPFPYYDNFEQYTSPQDYGYLPHYTADIADVFELADRPDGKGKCLRQVVPVPPISWAPEWQPHTIIGDDQWQDYRVSSDVLLNAGDSAGVMGRVNDVGSGYGSVPKGYVLRLASDGTLQLIVERGKIDKKALVGDAEQQALIKAGKQADTGGELLLGVAHLPNFDATQWHTLGLSFQGSAIAGSVDGKQILSVSDTLYGKGMAGLLAGGEAKRLSMPYYDNLKIEAVDATASIPTPALPGQTPIYHASGRSSGQNARKTVP